MARRGRRAPLLDEMEKQIAYRTEGPVDQLPDIQGSLSFLSWLDEVNKQIAARIAGPIGQLKSAQENLTFLSWLAWHCRQFAAVPSFLDAARSDIVAILYAGAAGLERSAYLHARSLLENLVRHCYYDSRPALFTARSLEHEEAVRDSWTAQFDEIQRLPHFRPTHNTIPSQTKGAAESAKVESTDSKSKIAGKSALFAGLSAVYGDSCRYVHGSAGRFRSTYAGIGAITMDESSTRALGDFLQRVGELSMLLLSMVHLGPYLLISQPLRRYLMRTMRGDAKTLFLVCMKRVSLPWAKVQRAAALRTLHERKSMPIPSRDGILLDEDGLVLIVKPEV